MRELTPEQRRWLIRAQELGFLGPKPIEGVHSHALGFGACVDDLLRRGAIPSSFRAADLGSGAGIPGLFLSMWFPLSSFLLIDSMRKRCMFLEEMVKEFDVAERVTVFCGRSEDCANSPAYRLSFDLVTARGFASPAATAENASGLLRQSGVLLVSEPPMTDTEVLRWPERGISVLGFSPPVYRRFEFSYCWMVKSRKARGKFPRGVGIPEKSPLF